VKHALEGYKFDGMPWQIAQVREGGSVAKGTDLAKDIGSGTDKTDIDIVVMLEERKRGNWKFKPGESTQYLDALGEALLRSTGVTVSQTKSDKSRQFVLMPDERHFSCDWNIRFDMLVGDPSLKPRDLLNMNPKTLQYLSASMTPYQVKFIGTECLEKEYLELYKDMTRLVKDQKNDMMSNKPSSFLVELLMLHSFHAIRESKEPLTATSVISKLVDVLSNPQTLEAFWTKYYNKKDIPKKLLVNKPSVIDPTNPTNNVAERFRSSWGDFQHKMQGFMQST